MRRAFSPRILPLSLLFAACAAPLTARTFTSSDGRTLEAEVLGFEGTDKVRIKRETDGGVFTLPIDSFGPADREALLAEAKAEAAKPPPLLRTSDLALELSRQNKPSKEMKWPVESTDPNNYNRTRVTGSVNVTNVQTAYTVTLVNRTNRPVENLRIDYVIYAETEERKNTGLRAILSQETGSSIMELLPANGRASIKTVPILTRKTDLKGTAAWTDAAGDRQPIDLKGVWVRVYQNGEMVFENATPASLATANTWPSIKPAANPAGSPGGKPASSAAR